MYRLNNFKFQLFLLKYVSKHRVYSGVFWKQGNKMEKAEKDSFISWTSWSSESLPFNPHTYLFTPVLWVSFISHFSSSQFSLTCSIVPGMKLYPNILYLFLSEFNRRVRTFPVFKALRTQWTLSGVFLYIKLVIFLILRCTHYQYLHSSTSGVKNDPN